MRVQKFDRYTDEEKEIILKHLWTYYGQSNYTSVEYEKYNELIKKFPDKVFEFAVFMFMSEINFQTAALNSIKNDCFSFFLEKLPKISSGTTFEKQYENAESILLTEIVHTYENSNLSNDYVNLDNDKLRKIVLDRNGKSRRVS